MQNERALEFSKLVKVSSASASQLLFVVLPSVITANLIRLGSHPLFDKISHLSLGHLTNDNFSFVGILQCKKKKITYYEK